MLEHQIYSCLLWAYSSASLHGVPVQRGCASVPFNLLLDQQAEPCLHSSGIFCASCFHMLVQIPSYLKNNKYSQDGQETRRCKVSSPSCFRKEGIYSASLSHVKLLDQGRLSRDRTSLAQWLNMTQENDQVNSSLPEMRGGQDLRYLNLSEQSSAEGCTQDWIGKGMLCHPTPIPIAASSPLHPCSQAPGYRASQSLQPQCPASSFLVTSASFQLQVKAERVGAGNKSLFVA